MTVAAIVRRKSIQKETGRTDGTSQINKGACNNMSTPSGMPVDQTSPAEFPSPQSNDEPNTANEQIGEHGHSSPSAYAPKRLRVVSSVAPEPETTDLGAAPRFLVRDNNKTREQPRVEPRLVVESVDGPMRLHSSAGDAGVQRRHAADRDDLNHPLEPNRRQSVAREVAPGGSDPIRLPARRLLNTRSRLLARHPGNRTILSGWKQAFGGSRIRMSTFAAVLENRS